MKLKKIVIILVVFNMFLNFSWSANPKITKDEDVALVPITIVPKIKITETNSLKSYFWWTSDKPKVPTVFKTYLKKIKSDLITEGYDAHFLSRELTENEIQTLTNIYLITGQLLVDSKNKESYKLKELSFYKISKNEPELLYVSTGESYTLNSNFKAIAHSMNSNKNLATEVKNIQPNIKEYYIVFETELDFEELNQIKVQISTELKLAKNSKIELHSSETNTYTFKMISSTSPIGKIEKLNYVRGPYKSKIEDNIITFSAYTEEELNEI